MTGPIRALVVDDSAYARQTIRRLLESDPRIRVVATAEDGTRALALVDELDPDVITLDLEMPNLGGFPFLRILMRRKPKPVVVVSSYASQSDVFRALDLGAVDFVAKPTSRASSSLLNIGPELRSKVLAAATARLDPILLRRRIQDATGLHRAVTERDLARFEPNAPPEAPLGAVVLVASLGGPRAVRDILERFSPGRFTCLVAVHMPAGFTTGFAARLADKTGLAVSELQQGERLLGGRVGVAPGGWHTTVEPDAWGWPVARLDRPAPDDRYVPSGNELLASAARVFGAATIAVVLTGMGTDGLAGCRAVKERGGYVIAESERSAVVFGMPRHVISEGLADEVLNLEDIPGRLLDLTQQSTK